MKTILSVIQILAFSLFFGSVAAYGSGSIEVGYFASLIAFGASFIAAPDGVLSISLNPKRAALFGNKGGGMPGMITPQGKLIGAADQMGNWGIKQMQGTSRKIYDTLPLDGRGVYKFFEGAGARQFPLTNLNQTSGRLGPGEALVMERMYLMFMVINKITGAVTAISTIDAFPDFVAAEFSFIQNNSRIIDRMPLSSNQSEFNAASCFNENTVLHFDTLLTIQPELIFSAEVQLPAGVTVADTYVRLVIEGAGAIPSTKQNF